MRTPDGKQDCVHIIAVPYSVDGKEQSIQQRFHISYLKKGTRELNKNVLAVAQESHKELHYIAAALGIAYGSGRDPNLEMLCTCREMQRTRVARLKNVLISLSNGAFSFTCHKGECPKFSQCPLKRDLTETRKAVPEALACAWFRQQQEGTSVPHAKRAAFF